MTSKLYLDVDGVIFPLPTKNNDGSVIIPEGFITGRCIYNICFNPKLPEFLQSQSDKIVWVTSWVDSTSAINEFFGLPNCPYLEIKDGRWNAIKTHIKEHDVNNFVWAEDIHISTKTRSEVKEFNGIFINPNKELGLTDKQIRKATKLLG